MKRKAYRNSPAFVLLAWGSFVTFLALMVIGLITLKEPLMVKGYYLMGAVGLISSAFTVAKVVRDNQEDEERYNQMFRAIDQSAERESQN
ncbi:MULTISPECIES: YiaA/YiaB family inner membrane protein [Listeria]|uniref:YiaA/YiaB family inner membrane protein n=1 Tax=Listeria TaxID=1637 RepID=UPI000B58B81A|nr:MULTISPECIES: YiaA/YiaB family inner membrane protein [Listeria]